MKFKRTRIYFIAVAVVVVPQMYHKPAKEEGEEK